MANYNRKDSLYRQAKSEGYRSRAAYKLKELDSRFGLLKRGSKVLDLGAWPGGWLQVAAERVGNSGLVVGVDLVEIEEIKHDNVRLIQGDVREEHTLERLSEAAGGRYDLVISDMAPKLTGIRAVDEIASVGLAELALFAAQRLLRPGGIFAAKVFKGNEIERFVKSTRPMFNKFSRVKLKSTRKTSNECYVIGFGLRDIEEFTQE
jgi:23S rRNA (uridine2552-2'-O)-methyltransferase